MRVGPRQDLFDRVVFLRFFSPGFHQELVQRRSLGEPAGPLNEVLVNRPPRFPRCVGYGTSSLRRPLARAGIMRVGPRQDLFDREVFRRLFPPGVHQERGQRRSPGKPAKTLAERFANPPPRFPRCVGYGTTVLRRPLARAGMMRVGPRQDLRDGQRKRYERRLQHPCCDGRTEFGSNLHRHIDDNLRWQSRTMASFRVPTIVTQLGLENVVMGLQCQQHTVNLTKGGPCHDVVWVFVGADHHRDHNR